MIENRNETNYISNILPPARDNSLFLIVSEISLVMFHIGHTEPLRPPLSATFLYFCHIANHIQKCRTSSPTKITRDEEHRKVGKREIKIPDGSALVLPVVRSRTLQT